MLHLAQVLLSISSLLTDPNPNDPLVPEIVRPLLTLKVQLVNALADLALLELLGWQDGPGAALPQGPGQARPDCARVGPEVRHLRGAISGSKSCQLQR